MPLVALVFAVIVGSFVVVHSCLDTSPRELLLSSPSPGRRWQAGAYQASSSERATGPRYDVRIASGEERQEFGTPVWKSVGVRPVALEWSGDDTLRVVVADDEATRANGGSVRVRPREGVDVSTVLRGATTGGP